MATPAMRWQDILRVAWPLIIANSFWNLQLTIDRIFVGAYSTEALGAAMAVMGVFWVPMALLQQTASYVTTFVAQYFGAASGGGQQIASSVWQAILVSIFGGLAFLLLMLPAESFFAAVGHSAVVQGLEVSYFNALTWSALPTALVAAISGFFTGINQTKTVMRINFVGLVLNVALDYLLIQGKFGFPRLGIAGAGYATALAAFGAAAYGFHAISQAATTTGIRISWGRQQIFNGPLLRQFLRFGIPSGCQWAFEGLAFTAFLVLMGRLPNGDAALASSSIAVTIMMLAILPTMGVSQAVMSLVGQRLGEGAPHLAAQTTWLGVRLSAVYICIVSLSFFVIPEFYLAWFRNQDNQMLWDQVMATTPTLLKLVGIFVIFDSIYLNVSFSLKGAGDTLFVSLIAMILPWPLMVLPAYLMTDWQDGVVWAWAAVVVYSLTTTLALLWRFQGGKWQGMRVTQLP